MEERSNEDLNERIDELTRKLEGDVEMGSVDIERERLFIWREIERHREEIKGHEERLATLSTLEAERREFSCIEAELRRRRDLVREALERDFEALEREEQEETERRRMISGSTRQGDLQEEGGGEGEPNNNQLAHDQNKLIVGFADGGGEVKAENAEEKLGQEGTEVNQ